MITQLTFKLFDAWSEEVYFLKTFSNLLMVKQISPQNYFEICFNWNLSKNTSKIYFLHFVIVDTSRHFARMISLAEPEFCGDKRKVNKNEQKLIEFAKYACKVKLLCLETLFTNTDRKPVCCLKKIRFSFLELKFAIK